MKTTGQGNSPPGSFKETAGNKRADRVVRPYDSEGRALSLERVILKVSPAQIKKRGKKKGLEGADLDRYVYGTLRKTGWSPKKK